MSLSVLILMVIVGLALILLDLFFIPGGVVAFIGLALVFYADYRSFQDLGDTAGWWFVILSGLASALLVWQFFRPSFWNRFGPEGEMTGKVNTEDLGFVKVGDRGKAAGTIRPSGMARINGELVEVHARSEMIAAGQDLEVTKIESNRIIVKSIQPET